MACVIAVDAQGHFFRTTVLPGHLISDFIAPSNCATPILLIAIHCPLLRRSGLAMPLFIPKEWSQKRDTRLRAERLEVSSAKARDALADDGLFFARAPCHSLSASSLDAQKLPFLALC